MFYLTNTIEEERIPENYWEILWTVEVCGNGTNSTMLYTGTFNTTMIFSYDDNTLQWSLVYYENVLPNTKECDACGDANKCSDDDDNDKSKPKRRRRRSGPKKDDDKGLPGKDDDKDLPSKDDDKGLSKKDDDKAGKDDDKGKKDDDKKRRLAAGDNMRAPRAANTRVTMFDQEGDGWWLNNYLGSSWYLADSSRTKLYHTGTLCDGGSGYCNMCIVDGEYTIRFTGNGSDGFTSWDFCGVTGTYGQELIFEVENGKCIPIAILDVERACGDVTITYTFESSIEVCLLSKYLNMSDPAAISTITQTLVEVMGADNATVIIDEDEDDQQSGRRRNPSSKRGDDRKKRSSRSGGKDDDKNSPSADDDKKGLSGSDDKNSPSTDDDKKRSSGSDDKNKPSTDDDKKRSSGSDDKNSTSTDDDKKSGTDDDATIYKHKIEFSITFTVHSDRLYNHEWLEEKYEELLAAKIANGTFISTLKANSLLYNYPAFNFTSCAEADDFELVSLVFVDSLPLEESSDAVGPPTTTTTQTHHQYVESATYDYSAISLFFGAVLLGFVAFVGILARGFNGYDSLHEESEHLDVSIGSSSAHSRHGLISGIEMDHTISNPLGRNAAHEADMARVSNAL